MEIFLKKNILKRIGGFITKRAFIKEIIFSMLFLLYDICPIKRQLFNILEIYFNIINILIKINALKKIVKIL